MSTKYNSLEELRRKKALLKKEVSELEDLLTFDNAKESLSALTNGFTDKYLQQDTTQDGETKISLKTNEIVKEISGNIKDSLLSKNTVYGFAKSDAGMSIVENALKLGAVTFVGNYARKSLYNKSWKKKLIGLALIYLAPIALRFFRKKLEQYEKSKTTSSFEQLI
ncbi:phosphoribosyl-ATP pyrophosphatase [Kaistella flava (ex Peng et al. 2021)]|uniref:Phosphoribosyl-ATP pyrophosphatase n=1 Tax=Kaistella flava (ex Peng et al. 2021) TaxID=2038776 RepID=A0A7M2Y5H4_9FLAO|nr:phosphoribosyl-ATP pyrophosphatase [Kaistella flava (ex Peng et al. 2021)]QOW09487.1 phosphoribosyl-ATP pyrophosphatase [Kaistella flava (ex Peng et al. 2021)]